MDRSLFEAQWPQVKNMIREKWASLTDEDLKEINGRFDMLVSKLQQKYGYTREQVQEEINRWSPMPGSKTYDAARTTIQDGSSLVKWLIAAVIALGLWWLWQASQENKTTETISTKPVTAQTISVPAASDTALNDVVIKAFQSNPALAKDLKDIKITTVNGVVSLSGTVSNNTQKDLATTTAKGVNGVKQVVNKLEVK